MPEVRRPHTLGRLETRLALHQFRVWWWVVEHAMNRPTLALLLLLLSLAGCTCRFTTVPAPANPASRVLTVERCVWGTAGLGEGRP